MMTRVARILILGFVGALRNGMDSHKRFATLNETIIRDYTTGVFGGFKPYELDDGTPVDSIEETMLFDLTYQGIHSGTISSLRKRLDTLNSKSSG